MTSHLPRIAAALADIHRRVEAVAQARRNAELREATALLDWLHSAAWVNRQTETRNR